MDAHVNDSHTLYEIRVTCLGEQWTVFRRFSWFLQLDKELSILIPDFVHRRASVGPTWLRSSVAPQVVEERKESLNAYISRVVSLDPEIALSEPVCHFLRISDDLRHSLISGDSHMPCIDDMVVGRSETETPEELPMTPPPVPSDEEEIVSWLLNMVEGRICAVDIKTELTKLNQDKIRIFFASLIIGVGERRIGNVPSTSAVDKLLLLQSLLCIESNLDAAALVSIVREMDLSEANFADFIACPTISSTKSAVFKVFRALGTASKALDDYALNQYLSWLAWEKSFNVSNSDASFSSTSHLSQTGLAGVFALGPNSPSARSVGPFSPTASMGKSQLASLLANEAREWVMFAVACDRDFAIAGSVPTETWRHVRVPKSVEKDIIGSVELKYRKSSSVNGEIEIKLDWHFPASTDMESVVNLIYDPDTYLETISGLPQRIRDLGKSYFGTVSLSKHRATETVTANSLGSCTPAMSCMSVGGNVLAKTSLCEFSDMRRIGGSAVAAILRSCAKSFAGNIVIASSCDPRGLPAITDPLVRAIRHMHFVGCEIDIAKGVLTGAALLSPESVFLVASDLLGERVFLWNSLANLSEVLKSVASNTSQPVATPVSHWLSTLDATGTRDESFS